MANTLMKNGKYGLIESGGKQRESGITHKIFEGYPEGNFGSDCSMSRYSIGLTIDLASRKCREMSRFVSGIFG